MGTDMQEMVDVAFSQRDGLRDWHGLEMDAPERLPAGGIAKAWHNDMPFVTETWRGKAARLTRPGDRRPRCRRRQVRRWGVGETAVGREKADRYQFSVSPPDEGAKSHVTWSSVTRLDGRSPEMGICRWWRRRREAGGGEAKRAAGRPASRLHSDCQRHTV